MWSISFQFEFTNKELPKITNIELNLLIKEEFGSYSHRSMIKNRMFIY